MNRGKLAVVAVSLLFLLLSGCSFVGEEKDSAPRRPKDVSHVKDAVPKVEVRTRAGNKSPYTVFGKTYTVMSDPRGFKQKGEASWYGTKFHGRNTSNGEVYDMYAMTAAHKSIPIPSYARVTNLSNGRSVIVRINDRGPFHGGRIVDLSYAAAKKLDFLEQGTAKVALEVITPGEQSRPRHSGPDLAPGAYLQVGAFGGRDAAEAFRREVSTLTNLPVVIVTDRSLHKVRVGPVNGDQALSRLRAELDRHNINQAHVVYD